MAQPSASARASRACDQGLLRAALAVGLGGGRGQQIADVLEDRERGDRDRARAPSNAM